MQSTSLNMLFADQLPNFAHLVSVELQTKLQFMDTVKNAYDINNPKTSLFYVSIERSTFETIRLSDNRDAILFNH